MAEVKEKNKIHEIKASSRYVRVSPYKLRPVVDSIRGKSVPEAESLLRFSSKGVASFVLKVLNSATANAAREDLKAKPEELVVSKVFIDEGPTLKRIEFRAMGRVNRIRKRTSHITVVLERSEEARVERQEVKKKEKPEEKGKELKKPKEEKPNIKKESKAKEKKPELKKDKKEGK